MTQDEGAGASATRAPMSIDEAKSAVLKQVEFYFADANLPFDKFLFTLTRKDPEGWVPIDTIASFKRMKPMREVLSSQDIAEALRGSTSLLEVDSDGKRVRRKAEMKPVPDAHARSIYAKGFPDEFDGLQEELESFFAQFGKINGVRMRRENEKPRKFKNSVFVEFADAAEMRAFLEKAKATEPQEDGGHGIEYKGAKLVAMSKPAYVEMKMKEKGIDPNNNSSSSKSSSSKSGRKFNAFREMERERRSSDGPDVSKSTRSEPLEFEYNGQMLCTKPDGTIEADKVSFPAQSVLRFTNASKDGSWKDLKDTLSTLHPTLFVEFPAEAVEGVVGFREPVSDEKLREIQDKGITVGGSTVSWERVGEDKARDFYVERANFRASFLLDRREAERHAPRRGGRGGGRGSRGGRGGRGGHAGRGGGHAGASPATGSNEKRKSTDEPPEIGAKRSKTTDQAS